VSNVKGLLAQEINNPTGAFYTVKRRMAIQSQQALLSLEASF
jgi:hypothetical protein